MINSKKYYLNGFKNLNIIFSAISRIGKWKETPFPAPLLSLPRLGKSHGRNEPAYCRGNMRSISRKVTVRVLSRYSIASWPYLCEMQRGWAWEIGGHILLGQRGHKVTVSSQNLWACSACCSWFGFALAGVLCGQVGWSPPILTLTLWWHSEFSSICSSILLCLFEVLYTARNVPCFSYQQA